MVGYPLTETAEDVVTLTYKGKDAPSLMWPVWETEHMEGPGARIWAVHGEKEGSFRSEGGPPRWSIVL